MAVFAVKSTKLSTTAINLSRASEKDALDIAAGSITPKVLCLAQQNDRGDPCITILNISKSTVIITSCGIYYKDSYYAAKNPTFRKSCFLSNSVSMVSYCNSTSNCTLEPGNFCLFVLPFCSIGQLKNDDKDNWNEINAGLAQKACFAFCAFSNHIEKSERPIVFPKGSVGMGLYNFSKNTEDNIKTLIYW